MSVRRRLPSPAMVVAIAALVAGLTGSAVALQGKNSVKSDDIAPSAVKAKDIHKQAVKPTALNLFRTNGLVGPISTASVAAVYARVTGQINGGGQSSAAQVHLFEPTLLPNSPRIMEFTGADPQIRFT